MSVLRRRLPAALGLGLWLGGLVAGMVALYAVFVAEWSEALAGIHAERTALVHYARAALGQRLQERGRLTRPDFEALGRRIVALAAEVGVPSDDFSARLLDTSPRPAPSQQPLDEPSLLDGGAWTVALRPDGALEGVAIDLARELGELSGEMSHRGLLERGGWVAPSELSGPQAVGGLQLRVSGRWAERELDAAYRYVFKSALLLVCGVLAVALLVLWMALRAKERRVLAMRRQLVETKQHLVATVSHELRTPLASVRLLAETLERRLAGHEAARDYPARIVRDVDGLSFLVDNILSFSRLEAGRLVPRQQAVRLGDVLDVIREELPQYGTSRVRLDTAAVEDLVFWADPDLLRLLLANLVRNACQHGERDPVGVGLEGEAGGTLRVRDNGVGIPAGEWVRVFEDFYRPEKGVPGRSRGSGLGLSICRRVMEAHGGAIRVADSGSWGTTFELTFPQQEE